jgi:adenylylsulfate kinase
MLNHGGLIVWLTGLSGAGKTTISQALAERIEAMGGRVKILDGDELRAARLRPLGFSKQDRDTNVENAATLANMLKAEGFIVLVAMISPFRRTRNFVLEQTGALEVFVDSPLDTCIRRDPKGLYARAARGEISEVSGLDAPYEEPLSPWLRLDTQTLDPGQCTELTVDKLAREGFIDDLSGYWDHIYAPTSMEKALAAPQARARAMAAVGGAAEAAPSRVLFVAALPKSGSTWLANMLSMVPGFERAPVEDPTRSVYMHDITPLVFDLLPPGKNLVLKLHTRHTPYNLRTLLSRTKKFVVLFRDLRDVCVSRYHHVLNDPTHRHHGLYTAQDKEGALLHCAHAILNEYAQWVRGWLKAIQSNPGRILPVRFEELRLDCKATMGRILDFHGIPHDKKLLEAMEGTTLTRASDLKANLKSHDTKRKGVVGGWRNEFTPKINALFRDCAGDFPSQIG